MQILSTVNFQISLFFSEKSCTWSSIHIFSSFSWRITKFHIIHSEYIQDNSCFFSKACFVLHVFPSSRYPHANSSKNFRCDRVEVSYYSWCSAMLELSLVNRTWDNSQADGCWLWMGGKSLAVQCRSAIMYIVYIIVCTVYMKINMYIYIYIAYIIYFYTVFEYTWYMFLHSRKLIMEQWTVLWRFNPGVPVHRNHGFAKGISFFFFAIFGVILGKSILS